VRLLSPNDNEQNMIWERAQFDAAGDADRPLSSYFLSNHVQVLHCEQQPLCKMLFVAETTPNSWRGKQKQLKL
jgi:hypothetical protein